MPPAGDPFSPGCGRPECAQNRPALGAAVVPRVTLDRLPSVPPTAAESSATLNAANESQELAAVDLGSNSFHLVIARLVGGEPALIDRHRDQVQLARGLDADAQLAEEAQERALKSLRRFGQRLRHIPATQVRAVGTKTLRTARNAQAFLREAKRALGHPIEVISGKEEGRLLYLGVVHSLPDAPGPRLVVDIGGGSTECILGQGFEALVVHSLSMGCVGYSRRFFRKGKIDREGFEEAVLAAELEFQTIERSFRDAGWDVAVGASGTMRAVHEIIRLNGWSKHGITPSGLKKLKKAMLAAGSVKRLDLKGLKPERAPVLPGGLAIIIGLFESLGVERMTVSSGALREGVVYDLLGRIRHEDVRERTIRVFQERYQVDMAQAARVERLALALLLHAPPGWNLDQAQDGRFLAWAARLHEIGLAVTYSHYHRHSGYLIGNSDMPGFSRDDQQFLATIVSNHRRKLHKRDFSQLSASRARRTSRLVVLLRLAVLLHRARAPQPLPVLHLEENTDGKLLTLRFPRGWLSEWPLTRGDLTGEAHYLRALGWTLEALDVD